MVVGIVHGCHARGQLHLLHAVRVECLVVGCERLVAVLLQCACLLGKVVTVDVLIRHLLALVLVAVLMMIVAATCTLVELGKGRCSIKCIHNDISGRWVEALVEALVVQTTHHCIVFVLSSSFIFVSSRLHSTVMSSPLSTEDENGKGDDGQQGQGDGGKDDQGKLPTRKGTVVFFASTLLGGKGENGGGVAVLASRSVEVLRTRALKLAHQVFAGAAIETGPRCAVVDVDGAVLAGVSGRASAGVVVDAVTADASVGTGLH